jgi:type IV pilus assembly protein PilC
MALVITPRQLGQRAELYHQLSQLTDAGIGLIQAIDTLRRSPPNRSFFPPLTRISAKLHDGATLSTSLRAAGKWLPTFDAALLEAGERSGRLPQCFKLLSNYYTERAQIARQVVNDLLYPAFLFHFAILIGPLPGLVLSGNIIGYLAKVLSVFVPIYAIVFLILFASRGSHGEGWRAFMERISALIPFLGSARRALALSRLASALEALINAGVPIIEAWELAASASGSPALRKAVLSWRPSIETGTTPAEALAGTPAFPEMFRNMYNTGEMSGRTDESLLRLQRYYQDEGTRRLKLFSSWVPKLIYFAIVIMIAYRVVSFYADYYRNIGNILGQ